MPASCRVSVSCLCEPPVIHVFATYIPRIIHLLFTFTYGAIRCFMAGLLPGNPWIVPEFFLSLYCTTTT
ncbi:hypothetical protein SAMN05660226_00677 [Parapedobacter luteus]|uniref:Uncharacterized protein n=1 Tax=Parapedobacter luteus TaxID=623280 RepID=A0A1T5AEX6_9SPHI|nr:hypothetical protein SAMN05660226_00677 [Parapedobacter luteus]